MKNLFLVVLLSFLSLSCGDDKKEKTVKEDSQTTTANKFDDSDYVLNDTFPVGDVRRYGVFPDSIHASGHKFTKKSRIQTVLDLSSNHGIEITFPKGYYKTALILKGRQNVKLKFDNAEFGGMIQIIEKDSTISNNIDLKGNLTTDAGVFIRNSENINFEDLTIKSDTQKNIYGLRSKGCHIYAGSKKININNLTVEDLGSGSEKYKYVYAGLTIDGWNNNPEQVKIGKVHIKSSDRHGVYITGKEHQIGEIVIDKFGLGEVKNMASMSDILNKGDQKNVTGLWINKAYDCFIDKATINAGSSRGKFITNFENGNPKNPIEIKELIVLGKKASLPMKNKDANFITVASLVE